MPLSQSWVAKSLSVMQQVSKKRAAHKIVACLVLVAAITCGAGYYQQQARRDAAVDWQDVSTTLLAVENAKRDLHQSLQHRITSDTSTRQQ